MTVKVDRFATSPERTAQSAAFSASSSTPASIVPTEDRFRIAVAAAAFAPDGGTAMGRTSDVSGAPRAPPGTALSDSTTNTAIGRRADSRRIRMPDLSKIQEQLGVNRRTRRPRQPNNSTVDAGG